MPGLSARRESRRTSLGVSVAAGLCLGAGLFASAALAANDRVLSAFTVSGWDSYALAGDDGNFGECLGSSTYNSGVSLSFIIDHAGLWHLTFQNQNWNYKPGDKLNLTLQVDGGHVYKGPADVVAADTVTIGVPSDPADMRTILRSGNVMTVTFAQLNLQFNLDGTNALLTRLTDCVQQFANAKTTPVSGAAGATVASTSNPPASGGSGTTVASTGGSPGNPPASGGNATPGSAKPGGGATAGGAAGTSTPAGPGPGDELGTGMVLTASGSIVTNNHVVKACKSITVTRPGDIPVAATLIARDEVNDLALLKANVGVADADLGKLRLGRPVPAGQPVAVFGFPLPDVLSQGGNIVQGNISSVAGLGNDTSHYQISAPIQPGNSGGPLLDFPGAILGVTDPSIDGLAVAGAIGVLPQNVNFAIKATVLANFLEANAVAYQIADPTPALDLVSIAAAAKKFTVMIDCRM